MLMSDGGEEEEKIVRTARRHGVSSLGTINSRQNQKIAQEYTSHGSYGEMTVLCISMYAVTLRQIYDAVTVSESDGDCVVGRRSAALGLVARKTY
jgi:hypothetical protein